MPSKRQAPTPAISLREFLESTPIGVTKTLSASDGIEEPTLARALKAPESIAQLSPPMTERNPYAPPQAEVRDAPAAPPTKGTLATRTLRLAGATVDSVASAVFVVPFLLFTDDWTAAISSELSYGMISLGGFASFTAMQGYLLATRGQTIGKWLVGTRIVRADNDEVPTLARTLGLRYGMLALGLPSTLLVLVLNRFFPYALIVFGLIDIALIFRRDRRCFARPDRRHEGRRRRAVTGYKCVMRARVPALVGPPERSDAGYFQTMVSVDGSGPISSQWNQGVEP